MSKKPQTIFIVCARWSSRASFADEIQESPTYESGMALRFARIKTIREDKSVHDVTTYERLKEMFEEQFKVKARL